MLPIIINIVLAAIVGFITFNYTERNINWAILSGTLTFVILQVTFALIIRKIVKKRTSRIEKIIEEGQLKLNRRAQMLQMKPQGGVKTMQKILENEQKKFIEEALEATKSLEPLYPWNLLLKKQVNTMRMQFYYQMKEFNKVDELLDNILYIDPMTVAMKIARLYKRNDLTYKKFFKKKVKKFKGDKAIILYALYSWILVKRGEIEEAIKILKRGIEKTNNDTLKRNWELLVNGKVKNFSNASLGEQWYSLLLEEPKPQKPKQRTLRRKGFF